MVRAANIWGHLGTILHHKRLVMQGCFRVGLYRQGIVHDLSKFSPTEFWTGVKYYQGNRSPNAAEREEKGYSEAWMHHKGRNKHHYEYWTDVSLKDKAVAGVRMPDRYFVEMIMDRIAACKTYRKEKYNDASALDYYKTSHEYGMMHPETRQMLERVLIMLAEKGEEETFLYLRGLLKKK